MNENLPGTESTESPKPDTTLPVLCHLLGLAWITAIPFASVIAPLVLWLWKRDTHPNVELHGKESVNFQISMAIYALIAGVLMFVFIGFILLPVVLLTQVILTIIGALEASKGNFYRYPLTIRFLK
jgi:uncharacterized Tic20 family protein